MAAIGLAIIFCFFLLDANCENEKQMTSYPPAFQQFLNSFAGDFQTGPAAAPPQPAPPLPSSYMPYPHWIHYNMAPMPFAVVPIPPGYTDYKDTVNKLPPFLEWILNRIQNFYSNYQSIPWEPEEPEPVRSTTSTSPTSSTMLIPISTVNEEISLQENSNSDLNFDENSTFILEEPIEALQINQNFNHSEISESGMNFTNQNLQESLSENNTISNEQEISTNLNSSYSTLNISENFEENLTTPPKEEEYFPNSNNITESSETILIQQSAAIVSEESVNNSTGTTNLESVNNTNNKDSSESNISLINNQTISLEEQNIATDSEMDLLNNSSNSENSAIILGKPEEEKLTIGLDTIYSVDEQTTTIKENIENPVYNLTQQEVSTSKTSTIKITTTTKPLKKKPIRKPIDSDAIYFPSYERDDELNNVPRPRSL